MSETTIRDLQGYETSRDYKRLWELAQTQSVVCVVDSHDCRDIVHTIFRYGRAVSVGVRGYGYIDAKEQSDFEMQCRAANLEWLVPNENDSMFRALCSAAKRAGKLQSNGGYLAANASELADEVIAMRKRCMELDMETAGLKRFFDSQCRRAEVALDAWRAETGRHDKIPDLGELLMWLMDKAGISTPAPDAPPDHIADTGEMVETAGGTMFSDESAHVASGTRMTEAPDAGDTICK